MQNSLALFFLGLVLGHSLQTFSTNETCTLIPSTNSLASTEVSYNLTETFTVIELDLSTEARCLDGSFSKFLFTPGSGSGADKFMFFWDGGGFCGFDGYGFLESCVTRSQSSFGSSSTIGDNGTTVTKSIPMGFFSSMQEYNSDFYNWNKVFIEYCDGSNHQGYIEEPVVYGADTLWFRGFNNTLGTLNYLRDHLGLFSASQIILTGGSAGSQAFYGFIFAGLFPLKNKIVWNH